MYKVMIIDDDIQIRERLKSMIQWDALSLELVCETGDSETAKELFLLYRPHIIISDINIPIISGLELAKELRKEDPNLQFIIITGYNDFATVQQSVNLGAIDLLSKPILPDMINSSLQKVVGIFQKEKEQQSSVSFLKQLIVDNLPQMQQSFFLNLISDPPDTNVDLHSHLEQLQISFPGPHYAVAMLEIRGLSAITDQNSMLFLLRDMLITNFTTLGFHIQAYIDSHSRLNCIISSKSKEVDNTIEDVLARTVDHMNFTSNILVCVGIGPTVSSLTDLHDSRKCALSALNFQCILGSSSVMHHKNIGKSNMILRSPEAIHHDLLRMFLDNNLTGITETLHNYLTFLSSHGDQQQKTICSFLFEYVQSITKEAMRFGIDLEQIDQYIPTISALIHNNNYYDYESSVLSLTQQILNRLFAQHSDEQHRIVARAKEYILNNLDDDSICLETVSDHIGLSRIYFCRLFHQTEGCSFNTYLKLKRIERAKELLRTTNMKIYEVSSAVGIPNAKYFSFVFKQTVGKTPLEYQKKI